MVLRPSGACSAFASPEMPFTAGVRPPCPGESARMRFISLEPVAVGHPHVRGRRMLLRTLLPEQSERLVARASDDARRAVGPDDALEHLAHRGVVVGDEDAQACEGTGGRRIGIVIGDDDVPECVAVCFVDERRSWHLDPAPRPILSNTRTGLDLAVSPAGRDRPAGHLWTRGADAVCRGNGVTHPANGIDACAARSERRPPSASGNANVGGPVGCYPRLARMRFLRRSLDARCGRPSPVRLRSALRRGARRRGRHPADALRRRGPARRSGGPPAARRAIVVLSLSQDDSRIGRGRACAPSRPTS